MTFWIVVKPETLIFCRRNLIDHLYNFGFQFISNHPISRWDQLSTLLYKDSGKLTIDQLNLQNVGRRQLFGEIGDTAELWILESYCFENVEAGYSRLTKSKYEFRSKHWLAGLKICFEFNNKRTIYHYSYYHVPDPLMRVIEHEKQIIERFL